MAETPAQLTTASGMRWRLLLAVIIAAALALAWQRRFVLDDAFITLRYAGHLVQGLGLVWNPGEQPLEGYTNFLWLLWSALPLWLGIEPVMFLHLTGLGLFAGTLLATWHLAGLLLPAAGWRLAAVALLGFNYTFSAYATSGMETQLQALLTTLLLVLALAGWRARQWPLPRLLLLSLLVVLALLTRPDSAVPAAVAMAIILLGLRQLPAGARAWRAAVLLLPAAVLLTAYAAWKIAYFGDLLPNTFYAKVGGSAWGQGLAYLGYFLLSYWLLWLPPLLVWRARALAREAVAGWLAVVVGLWCLYVAAVGGDFMEFRFLVPLLPAFVVLLVWLLAAPGMRWSWRALFAGLLLAGNLAHAQFFGWVLRAPEVENVTQLSGHIWSSTHNWRGIGEMLGAAFADRRAEVIIATSACGAIPYYSGLPTVDLLGLNDRWVARNGVPAGNKAGHRVCAPLSYLVARRVNLLIGHPWMRPQADTAAHTLAEVLARPFIRGAAADLPADAAVLEMPMPFDQKLIVVYLTRHAAVETAIVRQGWRCYPLAGSGGT